MVFKIAGTNRRCLLFFMAWVIIVGCEHKDNHISYSYLRTLSRMISKPEPILTWKARMSLTIATTFMSEVAF